jgi:ATP adenylyltransferase
MDRLWTPWRFDYISRIDEAGSGCPFCRILADPAGDAENFVLYRGKSAFLLLNLFPYAVGHVLIVANRHLDFLGEAADEELHAIIETARRCEAALRDEYHPDGLNLGFNLGRAAGAGVAHHLHMHVLPRWVGDANFVAAVSETRVLPEDLPRTYQRLLPHFRNPQS